MSAPPARPSRDQLFAGLGKKPAPAPAPAPKKPVVPSRAEVFAGIPSARKVAPPTNRPVPKAGSSLFDGDSPSEMDDAQWRIIRDAVRSEPTHGGALITPTKNTLPIVRDGWMVPTGKTNQYRFATPRDNEVEFRDPGVWKDVIQACADIVETAERGVNPLDELRARWNAKHPDRKAPNGTPYGAWVVDLAAQRLDGIVVKRSDRGYSLRPSGKDRQTYAEVQAKIDKRFERAANRTDGIEASLSTPSNEPATAPAPPPSTSAPTPDDKLDQLIEHAGRTADLIAHVVEKIILPTEDNVRYSVQPHRAPTTDDVAKRVIEVVFRCRPYPVKVDDLRNQFSDERRKLVTKAAEMLVDCGALARNPQGFVLVDPTAYDPELTTKRLEREFAGRPRLRLIDKLKERLGDAV